MVLWYEDKDKRLVRFNITNFLKGVAKGFLGLFKIQSVKGQELLDALNQIVENNQATIRSLERDKELKRGDFVEKK